MEAQLAEIKTTELTKLVQNSGLELNEGEQIKQSYLPYFQQLSEIKEQASKINYDDPKELDEKIARELRLKTVKVRTGSELVKDERKKIHALKANLEQSAWNLIKSTCLLEEENFLQVEKRREILEKQKQETLKAERLLELEPYKEFVSFDYLDLGIMTDESYQKVFNGAKLQHEAKIEADKKAAADKLEQEERQNKMFSLGLKWDGEQFIFRDINFHWTDLRCMSKEDFDTNFEKAKARKLEIEKRDAEILAENERLKKEAEAKQKEFEKQKKIADEKLKAEKLAHEKQQKEQEEKLRIAREAQSKIEAELKAKNDAELKAKKEADDKAKRELEAKQKEEKRLAKLGDRERLTLYVESFITNITVDSSKLSEEGKLILKEINDKFFAFKNWSLKQIDSL